jgi:Creatinase/Prolidase N-terminal domain
VSAPTWHDADGVDYRRLRSERLGRFQEAMRARDVAACLLFHPANIRYTTGTAVMDIYSTGITAPVLRRLRQRRAGAV